MKLFVLLNFWFYCTVRKGFLSSLSSTTFNCANPPFRGDRISSNCKKSAFFIKIMIIKNQIIQNCMNMRSYLNGQTSYKAEFFKTTTALCKLCFCQFSFLREKMVSKKANIPLLSCTFFDSLIWRCCTYFYALKFHTLWCWFLNLQNLQKNSPTSQCAKLAFQNFSWSTFTFKLW